MTTHARPPRKLTSIILVVVACKAITTFLPSFSVASLLGLVVLCYLAWSAYDGKQSAAKFLGICLVVLGVLGVVSGLYALTHFGGMLSRFQGLAPVWALLGAALAVLEVWAGSYILRSDEVKAFYQQREGFLL